MIKVLIADNHPVVRLGIKKVLESSSDIEVIADVSTTEELFNTLKTVYYGKLLDIAPTFSPTNLDLFV